MNNLFELVDKLERDHILSLEEYESLISNRTKTLLDYIVAKSDIARKRVYKNKIFIRGLIEISNYCTNDCYYCGIRKSNKACERYALSKAEIMQAVKMGYRLGFRTFVLQGGEGTIPIDFIVDVIKSIKKKYKRTAVTLSLGELGFEDYKKLRDAGADRYLLRHETADDEHYSFLHPDNLNLENRKRCLRDLRALGFRVGCGFMVGSPGASAKTHAKDLKFIEEFSPDMCGIGPFISHKDTPFSEYSNGTLEDTLFYLGLVRLIKPNILLPATTALGSLASDGREKGILAGANVVMPNLSPDEVRHKYSLYDGKLYSGLESGQELKKLKKSLKKIGFKIVKNIGDTLKEKTNMAVYDVKSKKAEEFINHDEILATIKYAEENKNNIELIDKILEKARPRRTENGIVAPGLTHREASVLLACDIPEKTEQMFKLAKEIKLSFYGNRIVMFAPLYVSNYCVNGCVYCPYHLKNKHIARKKLTQDEIRKEVIALQDMGHKRLALEAGEDPKNNPIEYILECIKTIYSVHHKNGDIRRVNVNIAATTVENYKKLKDAGIGTYILFQETYNKESYLELHPTGPKHDYAYHTEAMDRAMEGGIDDVGLGVLFGLESYMYEFAGLMMHAEHLEAAFGVGPHTISVPRLKRADDIDPDAFDNGLSDDIFEKIIACIRIAVPYTGMIISTRESEEVRAKALNRGISQISGGSRTSVGGYCEEERPHDSEQFDVSDQRTLEEVVAWLIKNGHIPSFCTACYREGRTGDRFMSLCKTGQIVNCCQPNALMTLCEFLVDYASEETRKIGFELIAKEVEKIPNQKAREIAKKNIEDIKSSNRRDFRF